jgi:23S rRNA pseudouridine2605 synthase/16S rRNA pseudouridine516 synthase
MTKSNEHNEQGKHRGRKYRPKRLKTALPRPETEHEPAPRKDAERIAKVMARAGVASRREAEAMIAAGRVLVNGAKITSPALNVTQQDRIAIDGKPLPQRERTRLFLFHKPRGLVTSARDPDGEGTVFDALLPALPEALRGFGWHAVGRLDRDTTGLLLFTNDERFVEHATSPKTHLTKRYLAEVAGNVTPKHLAALAAGMVLTDGPTLPASARARGPRTVELTLTEGRHHQVKRMLGKVKLPVLALHREAIGKLELDVELGQVRELPPEEVRAKLGFAPRG